MFDVGGGSRGHQPAAPHFPQTRPLKCRLPRWGPGLVVLTAWTRAGSAHRGLRVTIFPSGHRDRQPLVQEDNPIVSWRYVPQPDEPPVPGYVSGGCNLGFPVCPPPPFLPETKVRGGGPVRTTPVGASLRTLLGTHTWLAQGGLGPRQPRWRGWPQGTWLLPGSTCTWDCAWTAQLPPWATSFPGTKQARFPPDRTFGRCVKGARPGGF